MICIVCGILVSSSAVTLEDRQKANAALYKQKLVLEAVGSAPTRRIGYARNRWPNASKPVQPVIIDLATGEPQADVDVATFDQQRRARDPATSSEAPSNPAKVKRIPNQALLYEAARRRRRA